MVNSLKKKSILSQRVLALHTSRHVEYDSSRSRPLQPHIVAVAGGGARGYGWPAVHHLGSLVQSKQRCAKLQGQAGINHYSYCWLFRLRRGKSDMNNILEGGPGKIHFRGGNLNTHPKINPRGINEFAPEIGYIPE